MRAASPPSALPVVAATLPLVVAAVVALAVPSAASAARWLRPVPGEVARPFSYARASPFAAGAHRGADLAAAPGARVRAACAGTVVHAGPVARHGAVVSVRCGPVRVSYLPLASLAVRAGARVAAGARLGTVAPGHGGLHLGVRRERDPFGYVDPARLVAPAPRPATPLPPAPARAPRPAGPRPVPVPRPAAPRPVRIRPRRDPPQVPLPVWAGLGLLLAGAAGSGTVTARRRARRRPARRDRGARAMTTAQNRRPPRAAGSAAPLASDAAHGLLRHDADLLRERGAAPGPRVHDDRRRRPGAPSPPARRGRLLPHRHRRARRAGRPGRRARGRHAAGARRPQRRALQALLPQLNASNDFFIRTSDPRTSSVSRRSCSASTTTGTSTRASTRAGTARAARTSRPRPRSRRATPARSTTSRSTASTRRTGSSGCRRSRSRSSGSTPSSPTSCARAAGTTRRSRSSTAASRTSR